jgi:hypothetical protein
MRTACFSGELFPQSEYICEVCFILRMRSNFMYRLIIANSGDVCFIDGKN